MTVHAHSQESRPRRVTVTHGAHGWEVLAQRDDDVVVRASYTDWHRVERAVSALDPEHGADVTIVSESAPRE